MATVTIRFRGICCFIDPTNGEDFKKRVVLPRHGDHSSMEEHLPVIEFLADDLINDEVPDGLESVYFMRPGDEGQYRYVKIKEPSCIQLVGTKAGAIETADNLKDAVVSIDSLVPDEVLTLKKSLLGPALKVKPTLAAAVVDLPAGKLDAGSFETSLTSFPPPVPFKPRYLAKSLQHTTQVDGELGVQLTTLGEKNPVPKTLWFKATTRMVTIANEPLRLIVNHIMQAPTGAAAGHFDMYWDLIAEPPESRPVPNTNLGTGPGCAPSTKP